MPIRQEEISRREGWEEKVSCMTRHLVYAPNARFADPHCHEYFELLYGLTGTAQVLIGERVVELHPKDLVIVNAKEVHDVRCACDGIASYYVIKFLPSIVNTPGQSLSGVRYLLPLWQREIRFSPVVSAQELAGSQIHLLIDGIIEEWEKRAVGYELVLQANIMRIFVWLLRNRYPQSAHSQMLPEGLHQVLQRILEETPAHLSDWTAQDAAAFGNLSYSYFSRNFKKAYGISFTAYLESLRLREGERLLLTTDLEVTEISAALGFATTSYFIERFRLRYGAPPKAFRARMQKQI